MKQNIKEEGFFVCYQLRILLGNLLTGKDTFRGTIRAGESTVRLKK